MARAVFRDAVLDSTGNPLENVIISVYEVGTSTPIAETMYDSYSGAGTLANPFVTSSDGEVRFYLDAAKDVDVHYSKSGLIDETHTVAVVSSDHGLLAGNADDDHPQYMTPAEHSAADHSDVAASFDLDEIGDVNAPSPATNETLRWDGAAWVPAGHNDLDDYDADSHHNQSHAHDGVDGSGTVDHDDVTNVTADQHHNEIHDIDGAAHTGQLDHSEIANQTANDHHNQVHAIDGADHTGTLDHAEISSLTADDHHTEDHVARHQSGGADELNHDTLAGVSADDHHTQLHAANHASGQGDELSHGDIEGLGDDDHTQYHNNARHDAHDHSAALGTASFGDLADVNLTGLANQQIPIWDSGTGKWIIDPSITFDGDRLVLTTSGVTGGLLIGGDVNLYRLSANLLATDDAMQVAGAFTSIGTLTVGANAASVANARLNAAAATLRTFSFLTAGVNRWLAGANNTAESGSNAGSDFAVGRYSDAGSLLGTPLLIVRSTGQARFAQSIAVDLIAEFTGAAGVTIDGVLLKDGAIAGSAVDHGGINGLADDDHTQYLNSTRHDSEDHTTALSTADLADLSDVDSAAPNDGDFLVWSNSNSRWEPAGAGGGGTDHGTLTGLADDDHTQYFNAARHDSDDHSAVDHGGVLGLADDDHSQYHTDTRHLAIDHTADGGLLGGKVIGEVMIHSISGLTIDGYLEADGTAVNRTTYSDLFDLYDTAGLPYGNGNGSTTFNLPNADDVTLMAGGTLGARTTAPTHTHDEGSLATQANSDLNNNRQSGSASNPANAHAHTVIGTVTAETATPPNLRIAAYIYAGVQAT